ncbi:MAG: beta-propeller domain-containing protein [Pirellulales bacterium]
MGGLSKLRGSGRRSLGLEWLESRQLMAADLPEAFERFASMEEVKQFLLDRSLAEYSSLFGQQAPYWGGLYPIHSDSLVLLNAGGAERLQFQTAALDSHSSTNVQVAGVDEADLVETDGEHLFMLRGGRLTIADVAPASEMHVLADLPLEGNAVGAFLAGDRLTVISSQYFSYPVDPLSGRVQFDALPFSRSFASQSSVIVTVFDVADPAAPREVEQTKIEGNYVNARAIEDKVFVTISSNDLKLPPPQLVWGDSPPPTGDSPSGDSPSGDSTTDSNLRLIRPAIYVDDGFTFDPNGPLVDVAYESREAYLARITPTLDAIVAGILPEFSAWNGDEQFVRGGLLHEPADILKPLSGNTTQLTSIVAFDVFDDQSGPVAAEAIPTGWSSTQYASQDHLYFFETNWGPLGQADSTQVLRFDWDVASGEIHASAYGTFAGSLLNQFSADEFDGRLRVATTRWDWNASGLNSMVQNWVQVLEPVGSQLKVVGQTELVAPGESIQSVRFDGETGYVVTFRRIDPLFTVDLSDPTDPTVLGELKIPGFSGYLQVLDDHHVLGIGRAPGDGWSTLLQVSLFDVSDKTSPQRIGEYTFSPEVWNSQAEWDSHALTWMPELGLLALPINGFHRVDPTGEPTQTSVDPAFSYYDPSITYFSGLALLQVDLDPNADGDSDVTLAGIVEQNGASRSVRIGSTIYSISNYDVIAIEADDPGQASSVLTLPAYSPYEWPLIAMIEPLWIGTTTGFAAAIDSGESAKEQPYSNPSASPSPWDDPFAADVVHAALDQLAHERAIETDQVRLITIESADHGFNVVLGAGDARFAFRVTTEGDATSVELLEGPFEFPSEALQKEWHNADEPCDIDGDNLVAPLDALIVINQLNAKGAMPLRTERPLRAIQLESRPEFAAAPPFRFRFDSSGDDFLSPIDALFVINRLNAPAGAEGEAAVVAAVSEVADFAVGGATIVAGSLLGDGGPRQEALRETFAPTTPRQDAFQDAFQDAALQVWSNDDWMSDEETDASWGTLAAESHMVAEENPDDVFAEWSSH